MPNAGPGVKAVTTATTTFPGHLFPKHSSWAGRVEDGRPGGWLEGPTCSVEVSQAHQPGLWHLQLPLGSQGGPSHRRLEEEGGGKRARV